MTTKKTLTINKGKKDKKEKLTKADIGKPFNFQHISHAVWDPNEESPLEKLDPNLLKSLPKVRKLFNLISISSFVV
jgi:hypothetical protein